MGTGFDVLLHDTALVFWTTSDVSSLRGPRESMPLLRRLVGSLLTSNADPRFLAVYLTRQGVGVSWPVARVLDVCAGQAPRRGLRAHQQALGCAS